MVNKYEKISILKCWSSGSRGHGPTWRVHPFRKINTRNYVLLNCKKANNIICASKRKEKEGKVKEEKSKRRKK